MRIRRSVGTVAPAVSFRVSLLCMRGLCSLVRFFGLLGTL